MTDRQTLTASHREGFGPSIRVEIAADHGRWTEARALRKAIKDALREGEYR